MSVFQTPIDAWLAIDLSREEARTAYANKDRIYFQYWFEEINTTLTPNWSPVEVIGRSHPFFTFSSTGAKEIAIEFFFFAEGYNTSGPPTRDAAPNAIENEVLSNIRFLESLAYPIMRDDGLISQPATCILKLGKFILAKVILTAGPSVTYGQPWLTTPLLPFQAKATCTFTFVPEKALSAIDVLNVDADFNYRYGGY